MVTYTDTGRYRRVRPRWWTEQVTRSLDPIDRLLALYVLTGPQSSSCGIFRFSPGAAAEDLDLDLSDLRTRLDRVCEAFDWQWDAAARVLWLPSWVMENEPPNPNVVKSWRLHLSEIPACALKTQAADVLSTYLQRRGPAFVAALDDRSTNGSGNGSVNGSRNQEQDQEQDQEQKAGTDAGEREPRRKRRSAARSTPPPTALDLARSRASEAGCSIPTFLIDQQWIPQLRNSGGRHPVTGEPLASMIDDSVTAFLKAGGIAGGDEGIKLFWNTQWAAWMRGCTIYDDPDLPRPVWPISA